MVTLIRKCANARCADIIGIDERPNKKYCSESCKNKANNDKNKKGRITWDSIIEKYDGSTSETFNPIALHKWLKENYYPPRIIKQKK